MPAKSAIRVSPYEGMTSYAPEAVQAHLAEQFAWRCQVSGHGMRDRLREWPLRITQKVERAMRHRLGFLE